VSLKALDLHHRDADTLAGLADTGRWSIVVYEDQFQVVAEPSADTRTGR